MNKITLSQPGESFLEAHMEKDGLAIELRTSNSSVFITPAELDKLHAWYKEKHNEGHPFAIRLQDWWYPVEGGKSTKDKSEAKRFASMKEALDVRASLNATWQTDSVIERLPT